MEQQSKIIRTWKGWTTKENASIYENLLLNKIFPDVKKKGIIGLEKVSITIRHKKEEVEFFLVLQFNSMDAVKLFAGENYERAYMPEEAQRVLLRYDDTAQHYELRKVLEF
ncbi:MAG: antibiotic biosynthesis monooxygenase [Bacteroidota bacterium]